MSRIRVIREGIENKSNRVFSIVIRSADEPLPSTIQVVKESRNVEPTPLYPPGVSSLFHRHKAEQAEELTRIYNLMKEELNIVVDSVDEVISVVQETIVEDTLREAQARVLSLSGSFSGTFRGDGSQLKNLRWENIIGKRNRPGAGGAIFPTALLTASFAVSASHAETASFIDPSNLPPASLESGSLIPGRGIEITLSGSAQIIESDKESFVTFLDTQPALLVLRNQDPPLEEPEVDSRKRINLAEYRQARMSVQVERAGFSGSSVGYQYSADNGVTWDFLDGAGGPTASMAFTGSNTSSYVDLEVSAQSDILIRWIAQGGNGSADPRISTLILDIR